MKRLRFARIAVWLGLAVTLAAAAADQAKRSKRARPPKFNRILTSQVFFENAFEKLEGSRPNNLSVTVQPARSEDGAPAAAAGGSFAWSELASPSTIEDEVKSLKLQVDENVTTPSDFAGRGYTLVRRDFSVLAMLFAVITEYDKSVRWKESAAAARDMFARAASNAKAGGNSNVYNEAKLRKADLQDLINGQRLQATAEETQNDWATISDRAPLMQRLDAAFRERLKPWSSSEDDFEDNIEKVFHEAEMTLLIGEVLTKEGMEDGDDEDYAAFVQRMLQGAQQVSEGVKQNDYDSVRKAVGEIGKACDECHELYR